MPQGAFAGVDPVSKLPQSCLDRWTFINKPVEEALIDLEPFDFIFNDADHVYKSTLNQLYLSWEKLIPGGRLAGHDYLLSGVRHALWDFSRREKRGFRIFNHDMGCWMFDPKKDW